MGERDVSTIQLGTRIATVLALLLVSSSPAVAQARITSRGGQQLSAGQQAPALPAAPSEIVSPGTIVTPQWTARLRMVTRQPPLPFPNRSVAGTLAGYVPFLVYDPFLIRDVTPTPVQAGPLENVPTGGVQLDVEPRTAQVYVDGTYAGVVSDFSGYYKHLNVAAGPHLITIVAPHYEPLIISVTTIPGQTVTHRRSLTRASGW